MGNAGAIVKKGGWEFGSSAALEILLPASMKTLGFPGPALAIWMTLRSLPSVVLPMETVLTQSLVAANSSMNSLMTSWLWYLSQVKV